MERALTMSEIESEFDSEWVLVADPETDEHLELLRGRVVYHSKDREEVDRKAGELRPDRYAVLYTGELPENMEVVL